MYDSRNGICIYSDQKANAMKKVTFLFPTYSSMWSFKDKAKAVNVVIVPRKNTMTGLFEKTDIDLAVKAYQAYVSQ